MTKLISKIYSHYASADRAIHNLKAAGLSDRDISILASNAEGWHKPGGADIDPRHDRDRDGRDDRAEGAAAGSGIGALLGGAGGLAVGLGLIAIPGIGPVVAAGWWATTAIGAIAAGAAGGILGALVESGVSRENAELYTETLRRGGALVTAKVPDDQIIKFDEIMNNSAVDVERRLDAYRETGWTGYDPKSPSYTAEEARRERARYDIAATG